jgi:hypothetical protein
MKITIRDLDKGLKKFLSSIPKNNKSYVVVGITGKDANKQKEFRTKDGIKLGPMNLVSVATVHEFGSGNIPERSFLRATVDLNKKRYFEIQFRALKDFVDGRLSIVDGLSVLGFSAVRDCQNRIVSGIKPRLKPATIESRIKKSSTPLLDTGQLRQGITFEVRHK